jgi:septum formation inhibitor-activating ATPase MinD
MTQDQATDLLQRMFAVNEQIVRQNHQVLLALTSPTFSKDFKSLTSEEVKQIVANAQSYEWAVLMADSTIKAKNI